MSDLHEKFGGCSLWENLMIKINPAEVSEIARTIGKQYIIKIISLRREIKSIKQLLEIDHIESLIPNFRYNHHDDQILNTDDIQSLTLHNIDQYCIPIRQALQHEAESLEVDLQELMNELDMISVSTGSRSSSNQSNQRRQTQNTVTTTATTTSGTDTYTCIYPDIKLNQQVGINNGFSDTDNESKKICAKCGTPLINIINTSLNQSLIQSSSPTTSSTTNTTNTNTTTTTTIINCQSPILKDNHITHKSTVSSSSSLLLSLCQLCKEKYRRDRILKGRLPSTSSLSSSSSSVNMSPHEKINTNTNHNHITDIRNDNYYNNSIDNMNISSLSSSSRRYHDAHDTNVDKEIQKDLSIYSENKQHHISNNNHHYSEYILHLHRTNNEYKQIYEQEDMIRKGDENRPFSSSSSISQSLEGSGNKNKIKRKITSAKDELYLFDDLK